MKSEFKISYFLWKSRKDKHGLMPVYIRSKQNSDKQHSINTGVKLLRDQWNNTRNEPKNKPAKLIELEAKLKETYRDLSTQGHEPDLSQLIAHLNDVKKPRNQSIVSWCTDYDQAKIHNKKKDTDEPKYSEGKRKAVRTLKTNIQGFNPGLTFDKLTTPQIDKFLDYLTGEEVANNSQYKRLRALVNVAKHAGIDCVALTNYKMPYKTQNALKTRLTWPEVRSIMKAEPETKMETVAKDAFMLAVFSGLRISDILTLNRGELHEYHYERLQTKTKQPVLVTLHKHNEPLFNKYIKTGIPHTRQELSAALKEVLKRAGLDKQVVKVQAVGYNHKETIKEKWEEIAFHSGRRFYSRLLNDLGLGGEIARDELGHGYKSITDLYAGSPEHQYRVARVRKAMEGMEETLKELALMKVA